MKQGKWQRANLAGHRNTLAGVRDPERALTPITGRTATIAATIATTVATTTATTTATSIATSIATTIATSIARNNRR